MPDEQEEILEAPEPEVDEEEVSEDELDGESEEETTEEAPEEQPEEAQDDDAPAQEVTYTAAELRQMRALIDAQLAEQEAQSQPADQEEEAEDPFWDNFKGDFGDGTWLPEEAVAALKEREAQQRQMFQQMLDQQAQAFTAMIDQVADKAPAMSQVIGGVMEVVPDESFAQHMQQTLEGYGYGVIQLKNLAFAKDYPHPIEGLTGGKPANAWFRDLCVAEYGNYKLLDTKKPVSKAPVGIADGGAPSNAGGVTKGYTDAQNKEWEAVRKPLFSGITDEQELAKAKREYFS